MPQTVMSSKDFLMIAYSKMKWFLGENIVNLAIN